MGSDSIWRRFRLRDGAGAWRGRMTARMYVLLVVERIRLRHSERRYARQLRHTPRLASWTRRHRLDLMVDAVLIVSRLHWVLPTVRARYPGTPWPWSRCHCSDLADIRSQVPGTAHWCSPCAYAGHPECECSTTDVEVIR